MEKQLRLPIILMKAGECAHGDRWIYGVVSGGFKDLDGQVVDPEAIAEAIPLFMAPRGPTANDIGGPIRWHHNDKFEGRSHELPVGRITALWQDAQGFTHFQGQLSTVTKEAVDLWNLLVEGKVKFGASIGGVILAMESRYNSENWEVVPWITRLRIDEISITDNPAFRTKEALPNGSHGSYVVPMLEQVLQKSAGCGGHCGSHTGQCSSMCKSFMWQEQQHPRDHGRFANKYGHDDAQEPPNLQESLRALKDKTIIEKYNERTQKADGLSNSIQELRNKVNSINSAGNTFREGGKLPMSTVEHVPELAGMLPPNMKERLEKLKQMYMPKVTNKVTPPTADDDALIGYPTETTPNPDYLESIHSTTLGDRSKSAAWDRTGVNQEPTLTDQAVDNLGNPSPKHEELPNISLPEGRAEDVGDNMIEHGDTSGYNVSFGLDWQLENKPAVGYFFYAKGTKDRGDPKEVSDSNLFHVQQVIHWLQEKGIPYKVEVLEGAVKNPKDPETGQLLWNTEEHMRATQKADGVVEHADQYVVVAQPRTQEELERVAQEMASFSPWETPDVRVAGSVRPVHGFSEAVANVFASDSGPGRMCVLSRSDRNAHFLKARKGRIQVLDKFTEFLAD